jgi:hypothetical protein
MSKERSGESYIQGLLRFYQRKLGDRLWDCIGILPDHTFALRPNINSQLNEFIDNGEMAQYRTLYRLLCKGVMPGLYCFRCGLSVRTLLDIEKVRPDRSVLCLPKNSTSEGFN